MFKMPGFSHAKALYFSVALLFGVNYAAETPVRPIIDTCRQFLGTNPPGKPAEFFKFPNGDDKLEFGAVDGEYRLRNFISLHHMGVAHEDEKRTCLCMSFADTTAYTFGKDSRDPHNLSAHVLLRTQLDVLTSVVNVSTECWKFARNIKDCSPIFIPMPGVIESPQYIHSPLTEDFWANFQDDKLFSTDWIWHIGIATVISFPSHWVSNLKVSSLKTLEIYGNDWSHPQNFLPFLPNLDRLGLVKNNIKELPDGFFNNTPSLKQIILSQNYISKFPNSFKFFERLQRIDIKDTKGSSGLSIPDSDIQTMVNLVTLFLEGTRLETNVSQLLYLPNLRALNVSGCSISEIRQEDVNYNNNQSHLMGLDISFNNLTALPGQIFARFHQLVDLFLQHNSLVECPKESLKYLTNLDKLDMSGNKLTHLPSGCFSSLHKLQRLDLSHNQLESLDDEAFENLVSLKYLLLFRNKISTMSSTIFADIKQPIQIDLSSNRLTREPVLGIWTLNFLILSNNSLFQITNMTNGILSINYLDLSYNNIREVNIHNVNNVNLSYNTLTHLSNNSLKYLASTRSVDLGGNHFSCCHDSTQALKDFVTNAESTVLNLNTINPLKCFLTKLYETVFINELSDEDDACRDIEVSTNLVLSVGIPVAALGVLVIALLTTMYFYRFKLTYINHLLRIKKRGKERHAEMYSVCTYDAFVCYSGKDFLWVTQQLLPKLEEGSDGYRLCLHDRDFALGTAIDTNIIVSLEKSRKVIIVLTQDFIASRWCQLELEMANHRTFEQNREYVILIELERLDRSTVPRHLRFLMETRTYLEWPSHDSEEHKLERAWQRLRDSLGESIRQRTGKSRSANCSVMDIAEDKL